MHFGMLGEVLIKPLKKTFAFMFDFTSKFNGGDYQMIFLFLLVCPTGSWFGDLNSSLVLCPTSIISLYIYGETLPFCRFNFTSKYWTTFDFNLGFWIEVLLFYHCFFFYVELPLERRPYTGHGHLYGLFCWPYLISKGQSIQKLQLHHTNVGRYQRHFCLFS